MIESALTLVAKAHGLLSRLEPHPVYAGGVAVALLLPPESAATCKTEDLDCLFEAHSYSELEALHEQLRAIGGQPDTREDAPRCRWLLEDLTLDVLTPFEEAPGPHNAWHSVAAGATVDVELASGAVVRVLDMAHLFASKVAAFRSPYRKDGGDWYASKDWEDMATLLDGLAFETEFASAPSPLQDFVAGFLAEVASSEDARWAMEGHLAAVHGRRADDAADVLLQRIRSWVASMES